MDPPSPILCLGLASPLPSRPPYLAASFLRPGQIICSEKLSTVHWCAVNTSVQHTMCVVQCGVWHTAVWWSYTMCVVQCGVWHTAVWYSMVERCRTNYVRHVPPQGCVTAIQGLSFLLGKANTHSITFLTIASSS